MNSHGDEGKKIVPYQKGLWTISFAILIYVLGNGEISPSLSVALVGLTLHNPGVLEYAALAVWLWYLWKFSVHNKFAFNSKLLDIAQNRTKLIYIEAIKKIACDEQGIDWDRPESIQVLDVKWAFWWSFSYGVQSEFGTIRNEPLPKVPFYKLLSLKLHTLLIWLLRDESFSDEYLPLLVGALAGSVGILYALEYFKI